MKLSVKLFRIVFLVSLILIAFLYIFSKTFLLKSFNDIEIDKAHTDAKVVLNYIQNDLNKVNAINLDYARWNDTYNYLHNRNNEYIVSNFDDTTSMSGAKINFIFITDDIGNTIYKKNINDETKVMFTEDFAGNITSSVSKILNKSTTKNVMGFILYNKIPAFNISRKNYQK